MSQTDINSYMNQLGVLGQKVNSNYDQLRLNNYSNYLNTNNNTIEELVDAINQNLAELNLIQNITLIFLIYTSCYRYLINNYCTTITFNPCSSTRRV